MQRLNNRAFEILHQELNKCSTNDSLGQAELEIVLNRLEQMRSQTGSAASLQELREEIVDLFPHFSENTLQEAARANQAPGLWSTIKWTAILVTSATGVIWVLNLPYPMIRWPVAKTAPIILLPSYMSMNYHYRQAIAIVEQADQLVNQATSAADFGLGSNKAKQAQKHLDALPVWFLGYWPKYTFWLGWKFTLDEYKHARTTIGRMEAQLFQENNAQTQLTQAEQALKKAKKQYQQAQTTTQREQAIISWQSSIDELEQVPQATLAGKTATIKLPAYKRDFQQVASLAAAKEFASQARKATQAKPQTAIQWQQIANLWQHAINQVQQIPLQDPSYLEAQRLLAQYQSNLETVLAKQRIFLNPRTANLIAAAKSFAWEAAKAAQNPPHPTAKWKQIEDFWKQAIEKLERVSPEDSGYTQAQKLLASYKANLGQIKLRYQAEADATKALEQAQKQIEGLLTSTPTEANSVNRNLTISKLHNIINQLEKVKNGTSAYPQAQQLLLAADKKLKQLQAQ
ncbi:MAG: hypothetical protein F6K58_04690 [Symploca sp. SIO2E9]|nr:hypothetical protein [Symploca sp. SIO2E9]